MQSLIIFAISALLTGLLGGPVGDKLGIVYNPVDTRRVLSPLVVQGSNPSTISGNGSASIIGGELRVENGDILMGGNNLKNAGGSWDFFSDATYVNQLVGFASNATSVLDIVVAAGNGSIDLAELDTNRTLLKFNSGTDLELLDLSFGGLSVGTDGHVAVGGPYDGGFNAFLNVYQRDNQLGNNIILLKNATSTDNVGLLFQQDINGSTQPQPAIIFFPNNSANLFIAGVAQKDLLITSAYSGAGGNLLFSVNPASIPFKIASSSRAVFSADAVLENGKHFLLQGNNLSKFGNIFGGGGAAEGVIITADNNTDGLSVDINTGKVFIGANAANTTSSNSYDLTVANGVRIDNTLDLFNSDLQIATPAAQLRFHKEPFPNQAGAIEVWVESTSTLIVSTPDSATTTLQLGRTADTGRGKLCLWNGSNFTVTNFAAGSITPIYSTSTSCDN